MTAAAVWWAECVACEDFAGPFPGGDAALRAVGGHDDAYHGGRPTAQTVPDVALIDAAPGNRETGALMALLTGRHGEAPTPVAPYTPVPAPGEAVWCYACVGDGGWCPRCGGSGVEPDLPVGKYVLVREAVREQGEPAAAGGAS